MKKILPLLLVLTLTVLCFASCSKSEEAKAMEEKINSIGTVTLDKGELIKEAEKEYALLLGEDKGDVKNYDKLKEARAQYDALVSYNDKANALEEKLDKVFTEYGISHTEITEGYAELEAIKNSEENKDNEAYNIPEDIVNKMAEYNKAAENAKASAVVYVNGFYEINKDKDVTVTDIGCIAQTSEGTTYYLFAAKYTENGEEKAVYSTARFANVPSIQSMLNYKDNFYCESPASEKTDALTVGNVVIDTAAVLADASK